MSDVYVYAQHAILTFCKQQNTDHSDTWHGEDAWTMKTQIN